MTSVQSAMQEARQCLCAVSMLRGRAYNGLSHVALLQKSMNVIPDNCWTLQLVSSYVCNSKVEQLSQLSYMDRKMH